VTSDGGVRPVAGKASGVIESAHGPGHCPVENAPQEEGSANMALELTVRRSSAWRYI